MKFVSWKAIVGDARPLRALPRLKFSVSMIFAARGRPCGPAWLSKDHGSITPHRDGAVTP